MYLKLILVLFTTVCFSQQQKTYSKEYDYNDVLQGEGWMQNGEKTAYWQMYYTSGILKAKGAYNHNQKTGYWFFYNSTGDLVKEGHFKANEKTAWWIVYDKNNTVIKQQYANNMKEGYAFIYKNGSIFKAERYSKDILRGSWTSLNKFKKDNPKASF